MLHHQHTVICIVFVHFATNAHNACLTVISFRGWCPLRTAAGVVGFDGVHCASQCFLGGSHQVTEYVLVMIQE